VLEEGIALQQGESFASVRVFGRGRVRSAGAAT
jgi:hypothetical protein